MARKRKKSPSAGRTRIIPLTAMRTWWREHVSDRGQVLAKMLCWFVFLVAIIVGGAATLTALERYAHGGQYAAGPVKYTLELDPTPSWMPATLGRCILADVTPVNLSFDDPSLCREIHEKLVKNPWVSQVTAVRRVRTGATEGVVRVQATYRQPIARVAREGRIYHVDNEGVVLPYSQTPKFAAQDSSGVTYFLQREGVPANLRPIRIHYITVEGVEAPPPGVGKPWPGDDLVEGLRLVRLLSTRPYANQISVVDVRNHRRRISESEPEMCVYAQQGHGKSTEIRFGRFPHPEGGDWVISPARKMQYLDDYVNDQNGRLAGVHSYIDVRFDELRISLN